MGEVDGREAWSPCAALQIRSKGSMSYSTIRLSPPHMDLGCLEMIWKSIHGRGPYCYARFAFSQPLAERHRQCDQRRRSRVRGLLQRPTREINDALFRTLGVLGELSGLLQHALREEVARGKAYLRGEGLGRKGRGWVLRGGHPCWKRPN